MEYWGIIFTCLWMTWPIFLLLFFTKRVKGFYFYGPSKRKAFLEKFNAKETIPLLHRNIYYRAPLKFSFFLGDTSINEYGIRFTHSQTFSQRAGCLIFFSQEDHDRLIPELLPPSSAVIKSIKANKSNNGLTIKGHSTRELFNASFTLEISPVSESELYNIRAILKRRKASQASPLPI